MYRLRHKGSRHLSYARWTALAMTPRYALCPITRDLPRARASGRRQEASADARGGADRGGYEPAQAVRPASSGRFWLPQAAQCGCGTTKWTSLPTRRMHNVASATMIEIT